MNEKISDQKIVRHYLDRLESAILETKIDQRERFAAQRSSLKLF